MSKNLTALLFLLLILLNCCDKGKIKPGCSPQVCTKNFVSIGIHFLDKQGQPVSVENFHVLDLRTHLAIGPVLSGYGTLESGYYVIADDNDLSKLSTEGDDIEVSGTDPASSQTKTTVVKISGGCTCHVAKVSGATQVIFD